MHNEEDESWGRYAAACIRQLCVGVGFLREDDQVAFGEIERLAGKETARVVSLILAGGAAAWFFTSKSNLHRHRALTVRERETCLEQIKLQGWCVWVKGPLPGLPRRYEQVDPPSH